MIEDLGNSAYIDGSNLHQGVKELGWVLDYEKFRIWIKDKYDISTAYIFLGYNNKNKWLYQYLEESGFILIFKEVIRSKDGKVKGNCDAELILKILNDYHTWQFWKAIIVSSDGDFACIAEFLHINGSFLSIISPRNNCSVLLRRLPVSVVYLDTQRSNLELTPKIKKALDGDGTP